MADCSNRTLSVQAWSLARLALIGWPCCSPWSWHGSCWLHCPLAGHASPGQVNAGQTHRIVQKDGSQMPTQISIHSLGIQELGEQGRFPGSIQL